MIQNIDQALKKFEQRFFGLIINNYEKTGKLNNDHFYEAINKYLLLIFPLTILNIVLFYKLFGFNFVSKLSILFSVYCLILLIAKKKDYMFGLNGKYLTLITYLFIILFHSTQSYSTNFILRLEYYLFPLLSSIPFVFNKKYDLLKIVLIFSTALFFLVAPYMFDFDFIPRFSIKENSRLPLNLIIISHIIISMIFLIINIYFVLEKDRLLKESYLEKKHIENNYIDLEEQYLTLMRNQFVKNKVSDIDIEKLIKMAITNTPTYFEEFCLHFPTFKSSLTEKYPEISLSDMDFLSLMKLNFDTKKIAQVRNLSVRAVESKKYLLKKKLHVPANISIHEYILLL